MIEGSGTIKRIFLQLSLILFPLTWHRYDDAFAECVDDGDADVGLLERADIIGAITAHQCKVAQLVKHANNYALLSR